MTTSKKEWKALAEKLGERMRHHAFCDQHPLSKAEPDTCPFCDDRRAYLAYVTLMERDGTPRARTIVEVYQAEAETVTVDELLSRTKPKSPSAKGLPKVEWTGNRYSKCDNFAIQTSSVREEGFFAELWLLTRPAREAYKRLDPPENGWYGSGAIQKCKALARRVAKEMENAPCPA